MRFLGTANNPTQHPHASISCPRPAQERRLRVLRHRMHHTVTMPTRDPFSRRPPWSLLGVLLGAFGYVVALRPSLLARTSLTQAMACALIAMTMYAIGAIIEGSCVAIARGVGRRRNAELAEFAAVRPEPERVQLWIRIVVTVGAIVAAALFTPDSIHWQVQQRDATAVPGSAPNSAVVIILTLVICAVLLLSARGLRAAGRGFARLIGRLVQWPYALRSVLGGLVVFAIAVALTAGGLSLTYVAFQKVNNSEPAGQSAPTTPLRSGGPGSLISWQSLGVMGRWFVQGGPTINEINVVTGRQAMEPIRIFAGLESANGIQAQADLALADFRRAGGLDRAAVILYTPSTNGLVDPTASAAAEYISGGNVASVSLQYTVFPSFLSLLLSQDASLDAGTVLLNTFRKAVDELPVHKRPKVFVYGESLGAFGSLAPFAGKGIAGLTSQVDGAVWAGPPANSVYWEQISALASTGPTWQPIVDSGRVIRFAADSAGLAQPPTAWGDQRGVFLQNATDPVVWWSPSLILSRPGWLNSPRGPDVPAQMTWIPLLTFEQVLIDMPAAGAMPPGIGHNYLPDIGPAWVSVLQPPVWTPSNGQRLQFALDHQPANG